MTSRFRTDPTAAEGFGVLHKPDRAEIDIVFVHGLGGHPYKTWACPRKSLLLNVDPASTSQSTSQPTKKRRRRFREVFRRLRSSKSNGKPIENGHCESGPDPQLVRRPAAQKDKEKKTADIYWPEDLLAKENYCRHARILAYGYDSKVSKGFGNANQNGLFTHAKDLLYALQREKPARRPVIFVAHSLGGLLLKEVLRRSEASEEAEFKDIVRSTKGVIFLGTPHRGSPGMADLGEMVRSIAGAVLRVDSNAALLRALGADSPELELGRESFLTLWRKYGFRVKTFQEAWGVIGVNVGPLNSKVVPDVSSTLDDPREHAESISANHMNMCRFNSEWDAGYRKIALEIESMAVTARAGIEIDDDGRAFLQSLSFSEMNNRRENIQRALEDTCNWLYSTKQYEAWSTRTNMSRHHGLLWIKGKPGSGKSTLMKEALRRAEADAAGRETTIAGFFFNARGTQQLEKTPIGLYRSLLHQVLRQDVLALSYLTPTYKQKAMFLAGLEVEWHREELQDILVRVFATPESRAATIFIDAMDECNDDEVRDLVRFFKRLAKRAWEVGAHLNVCLSSRHYPHISIDCCPEVVLEDNNRSDILLYIVSEAEDNRAIKELKNEIFEKSSGVFLWVVLAIAMLREHGRGKSRKWLQQKLREIPPELDKLFRSLFCGQSEEEAHQSVCLMQIMLFAMEPLTLRQIHLALSFARSAYGSFAEWRNSVEYLETDEKRHELIVELSKGLLEVTPSGVEDGEIEDNPNTAANKHTSEDAPGGPTYQFIHETVREFFLSGDGFVLLHLSTASIAGTGHSMMATCCLNYLNAKELSNVRTLSRLKAEPISPYPDCLTSLLVYAVVHAFDHMDLAEAEGISQDAAVHFLDAGDKDLLRRLAALQKPIYHHCVEPGSTVLMAAVRYGAAGLVHRILQMGYDVNEETSTTPRYALQAAAMGPVKLYVPEDSFIHQEIQGQASQPRADIVQLLLDHGATVSLYNHYGQTPLHIAVVRDSVKVVGLLVDHGADFSARDFEGETPLHRAQLSLRSREISQLLLEHGARIDIKDNRGRTPIGVARAAKHLKDVATLMEQHLAST